MPLTPAPTPGTFLAEVATGAGICIVLVLLDVRALAEQLRLPIKKLKIEM
jgi:hypothetical protein